MWQYVLLEDPTPPNAENLAAAAAEEDRRYPECHNAMYRRAYPDWLEEKLAFYTELSRERRWQEIECYLNGGGGPLAGATRVDARSRRPDPAADRRS